MGIVFSKNNLTSKKYNQFVQGQMKKHQSDLEKLVYLTNKIIKKFHYTAYRNKIILLDYNTSRFIKFCDSITEDEFHTFRIHVPDILYYKDGQLNIIEIDGWIHNAKQKAMEKDKLRKLHYKQSGIPFFIVNEEELTIKNKTYKPKKGATKEDLWEEIDELLTQKIN